MSEVRLPATVVSWLASVTSLMLGLATGPEMVYDVPDMVNTTSVCWPRAVRTWYVAAQ
jgi:hypothetical protein